MDKNSLLDAVDLSEVPSDILQKLKCMGCPYPSVGFICQSADGSCMRTYLATLRKEERNAGRVK